MLLWHTTAFCWGAPAVYSVWCTDFFFDPPRNNLIIKRGIISYIVVLQRCLFLLATDRANANYFFFFS